MKQQSKKREIIIAKFEILPVFVAIFAVGIHLSGLFLQNYQTIFFAFSFFFLLSTFISFPDRYKTVILIVAALSSGIFYGSVRIAPPVDSTEIFKLDGCKGELTGILKGDFYFTKSESIRFTMSDAVFNFDSQLISIPGKIICWVKKPEFLPEPEQIYKLNGTFFVFEIGRLPTFKSDHITPENKLQLTGKLTGKIQREIRNGLKSSLPKRHAAIILGFILGDTSMIDEKDRQLFKENGISHLLAVSGQHLMVLTILLAAILHWFKVPPVSRSILICIILALYALITTGSPSIWRALIMYLCITVVFHSESSPSPVRAISIAGFILLIYDPSFIANMAFQLSFTAVISIIYLHKPFEECLIKRHIPSFLSKYLAVAFAANLGTMPMCAYLFGTVSISALIVNPLILWSFSYILPLAFIVIVLAIIWPSSTMLVAPALSLSLDGWIIILEEFIKIPGHFFHVGNISGISIVFCYAFILLLLGFYNKWQLIKLDTEKIVVKTTNEKEQSYFFEIKQSGNDSNTSITAYNIQNKPESFLRRPSNLFKTAKAVENMDNILSRIKRRSLKQSIVESKDDSGLSIALLSLENQNLYHQLIDLDKDSLKQEPERIIQAYIYLMALTGREILDRIPSYLKPPPEPEDLKIPFIVKNRFLAVAVLTESLLNSRLLTRVIDNELMLLISSVTSLLIQAQSQLWYAIYGSGNEKDQICKYLSLRKDLLHWCGEFVVYDIEYRRKIVNI